MSNNINVVNNNISDEMKKEVVNMTNNKFENPFENKKQAYEMIIQELKTPGYFETVEKTNQDAIKFLEHELGLLNKKAASATGKKKDNSVNEAIAKNAVEVLIDSESPMTLSMMIEDARLATFIDEKGEEKKMTIQKLNFCIRFEEQIVSEKKKGKMFYTVKK